MTDDTPPQLRIEQRYLQTPMLAYRHPDTGRRVSLVSMVHEGWPRYYHTIRDEVNQLAEKGARVHYETTWTPRDVIEAEATPREREIFALQDAYDASRNQPLPKGLVSQAIGLRPRPETWEPHDLTLLEIIRELGPEVMERRVRNYPTTMNPDRLFARHALAYYSTAWGLPRTPQPTDRVMLDLRNERALTGVDETLDDVVLMWGADHVPGLHRGLVDRGFTHDADATAWFTVCLLPSFRRVWLRTVAAGLKARVTRPSPVA